MRYIQQHDCGTAAAVFLRSILVGGYSAFFLGDVANTGNAERGTGNRERESGNECTAVTRLKIQNGVRNDVFKH